MKYLIINGSSRKGNTWSLVELVRDNIIGYAPESSFEEIHLAGLDLPYCTGCSLCFRKGNQFCPHYTIMKSIIDKIDECDGLIYSVTTYNMQPTAITKNLVDHLCFMLHRPHFFRKKAVVISTVGAVGGQQAVKYLAGTLMGIGFNRCYRFPVSSYSWNSYIPDAKAKEKCRQLALKFHHDVSSGKMHAPSFAELIPYNLFRGMSIWLAKGAEYETEDGVFWLEPSRRKYVYDESISVPFIKKMFGHMFYLLGKVVGESITVTYKK